MAQVGRAPLHVAAQTGNLESLIRLLDAGAGRAPRDRVSLYSIPSWHMVDHYIPSVCGGTSASFAHRALGLFGASRRIHRSARALAGTSYVEHWYSMAW